VAGHPSVARGQVEAAPRSGSADHRHALRDPPQPLKNHDPSLVTQFIVLFKDTSLASIIGFMDLTKAPRW